MTEAKPVKAMKVEQWPLDKLTPYGKNPRKITEKAIDKVAASITEYGFRQPIVVDAKGVIIAGHTRYLASKKLNLDTVPVHVATDLTPQKIKAYRIADNRTGQESVFDNDLLSTEMGELYDEEYDLKLIGFDPGEIAILFGIELEDPAKAWDGMPEFENEDQRSAHKIIVHFANMDDVRAFAELVGQNVTDTTKSIWYPKAETGHYVDKRYAGEGDEP